MRGKVAIVGAGMIPLSEHFSKSFDTMVQQAYKACVKSVDKGFDTKDLQAGWLANWSGGMIGQGTQSGGPLAHLIGNLNMGVTRVENGCPTGGDAVRNAALAVASGAYDVVLALGCEKMRDKPNSESLGAIGAAGAAMGIHPSWTLGGGGPTSQALHATRQMYELGYTMEDFARVAVKNHKNGVNCPYAHYRFEITIEKALASPIICWPLHLFDCCPQTDGAAAVILCRADMAKKYTDKPVYIMGTHVGHDFMNLWDKRSFIELPATIRAAKGAFGMAGIKPSDVDFAELHDCFTNTELMDIEDVGFCRKGEAASLLKEGVFNADGKLPINPSGGLKSHGHPIAATGISQMCELFWQLREEAGKRQVKIKNGIGVQHNVGGIGFGNSIVTILSRSA